MDIDTLARQVLADRSELFGADFEARRGALAAEVSGRTVLVIGAGGSIGRATARALLDLRPRRTLLVDISENGLTAVTRLLRNLYPADAPPFEAWALDFSSPAFAALLDREQPDVILNFAALKHVRSEKDALTLAGMYRVNVLGNLALLNWARQRGGVARVFSISTDKAANPASAMGATKRMMEQLLFAAAAAGGFSERITSTRFANVLFSDGSLPQGFLDRMDCGHPLAGPSDVRRYFITPREAARLCLLAAFHPADAQFLVPKMREADMLSFVAIAERLLRLRGFEPRHYGADMPAAFRNLEDDIAEGYWPCMFTPASTSGEKPYEEFREDGEPQAASQPYADIEAVAPAGSPGWDELAAAHGDLARKIGDPAWLAAADKDELTAAFAGLVPSFRHVEAGANLDQLV